MNLKHKLNQPAVYWPPAVVGKDGSRTYGTGISIRCRWEDSQEVKVDSKGNNWTSKAAVDTDYDVREQGILWLGKLEDVTAPTTPLTNPGASQIKAVEKVPNRRAKQTLFTAYL